MLDQQLTHADLLTLGFIPITEGQYHYQADDISVQVEVELPVSFKDLLQAVAVGYVQKYEQGIQSALVTFKLFASGFYAHVDG